MWICDNRFVCASEKPLTDAFTGIWPSDWETETDHMLSLFAHRLFLEIECKESPFPNRAIEYWGWIWNSCVWFVFKYKIRLFYFSIQFLVESVLKRIGSFPRFSNIITHFPVVVERVSKIDIPNFPWETTPLGMGKNFDPPRNYWPKSGQILSKVCWTLLRNYLVNSCLQFCGTRQGKFMREFHFWYLTHAVQSVVNLQVVWLPHAKLSCAKIFMENGKCFRSR